MTLRTTFTYGVIQGPGDLDPQVAYDNCSFDVIDQVCEGLFRYNLSDPSLAIIPNLAVDYGTWSADKLNYTVMLRQNVTFHDGTKFNATAVKFSFDRLDYFIEQGFCHPAELYYYWDVPSTSSKLIINKTKIIDEYIIKFVLNTPYAPLPALLCFSASYILSPTSTSPTIQINAGTGDLVGTGPFIYDGFEPGIEVNFHAFENYWRGKADIEIMKFAVIDDAYDRNVALLAGDIDFLTDPLTSLLPILEADPKITVLDSGKTKGIINYLGMNNRQINKTWRQAISYSIDYNFIIEEIRGNHAVRLNSPVPNGILYANDSFNVANLNLTKARILMQSMGFGVGFDLYIDAEWVAVAEGSTPFTTYNYTYDIGNIVREGIAFLLMNNLKKIGIKVSYAGMSLLEYNKRYSELGGRYRDMLQLYFYGWSPRYNDPSNLINPLMTNRTIASNGAQINDSYLQDLIETGLTETNPTIREGIYEEIQRYCVEDLMPWAFAYVNKLYHAHLKDLTGFQQNYLSKVCFYECKWNRTAIYEIEISHPADITYYVGSTGNNITWIITSGPLLNRTYYVYRNDTLNETNSWESGFPVVINIDGLPVGNYEYRIEARNVDEIKEDVVKVFVNSLGTEISHPADITYVEGSIGNSIIWNITAHKLLNSIYYMYRNNTLNNTNSWESGVPINISIDGLSTGVYEYFIEAHNGDDIVGDVVIVSVISKEVDQELKIIPGYPIIILFGISFFILPYIYKKIRIKY